jgi:hypothetical protein
MTLPLKSRLKAKFIGALYFPTFALFIGLPVMVFADSIISKSKSTFSLRYVFLPFFLGAIMLVGLIWYLHKIPWLTEEERKYVTGPVYRGPSAPPSKWPPALLTFIHLGGFVVAAGIVWELFNPLAGPPPTEADLLIPARIWFAVFAIEHFFYSLKRKRG